MSADRYATRWKSGTLNPALVRKLGGVDTTLNLENAVQTAQIEFETSEMVLRKLTRIASKFKPPVKPVVPDVPVVPSALLLAARAANIVLGTSIRNGDEVWREENRAFLRNNVDEYTSGIAFLPDHLYPSYSGAAQTRPGVEFMERARRDGKRVHIHCPLYSMRIENRISGATAALAAGNLDTAKAFIRKLLDATAVAVPADYAGTIDVVNEDVSGDFVNRGWIRYTLGGKFASLIDYWKYCFEQARLRWPKAKLFICMNNTEETGNSAYHQAMRYQFLGYIKRALAAGVDFNGVNLQGHCIFQRNTVDGRFVDFLKALRGLGLRLRLGELDVRAGSDPGENVSQYTKEQYDQLVAKHHAAILTATLPYITDGVALWTLSDVDNSWKQNTAKTRYSGERPCVFDDQFRPKPVVYDAVVAALRARTVAMDFTLDPARERIENGNFVTDLRGFGVESPVFEWVAGQARGTSTGTAARLAQVIEVEPGQTLRLNLGRPTGTSSIHVAVSQSLSTTNNLAPANTAFASTYPETPFVVPAECYALAVLLTVGNGTAGRTAFVRTVSFKT